MNTRNAQLLGWVIILVSCSTLWAQADKPPLPLVPYPQEVAFQEGEFVVPKALVLKFAQGRAAIRQTAETCVQDLAGLGFSATFGKAAPEVTAGVIELTIQDDQRIGPEGYHLAIGSKITISAATDDGLFWGTRSLLQLLQAGPGKAVPRLTITDKPTFGYRGLMIDNARRFHSLKFHIDTIKKMSSFKLNRYQIHFSDNESYTLPSEAFPELPTKDRHYSREQARQLAAAAQRYHVMIVPEIDVPGHAAALTRGIPSLKCTNVPASTRASKLCIGKEQTYQTLEKLFSEIMEMIPGEYWHLGADEVGYGQTACEACRSRMQAEQFKDGSQLFRYFINRMHGFVKRNGREMLV